MKQYKKLPYTFIYLFAFFLLADVSDSTILFLSCADVDVGTTHLTTMCRDSTPQGR